MDGLLKMPYHGSNLVIQVLLAQIRFSIKVGVWGLDVVIKSIDFALECLHKPSPVTPFTKTLDLPNHVICGIVDNILGDSGIRVMDPSANELKSLRLTCCGLLEPISELLFREGHLFLHRDSLARIDYFSNYIKSLVVWLPVFVVPGPSHPFWRYGGSSWGPSQAELAYTERLEPIWYHHSGAQAVIRNLLNDDENYMDPWHKLGYIPSVTAFEQCEEVDNMSWATDDEIVQAIRDLLPQLHTSAVVLVRKYTVLTSNIIAGAPKLSPIPALSNITVCHSGAFACLSANDIMSDKLP